MLYTNKILKSPKFTQQKVRKFMKISKNDLKSRSLFQMESWDELKMGRKGEGGCCRGVNENYHKIYPNIYHKIYLNRLTKFIKPNNKKANFKKLSFAILTQIGEDHYPLAERVSSWITWSVCDYLYTRNMIFSFKSNFNGLTLDLCMYYTINLSTIIVILSYLSLYLNYFSM